MQRNDKDSQIRELVVRLGRPSIAMLNEEIAWHRRRKSYGRLARSVLTGLIAAAAAFIIATNLWVAMLQVDGSSMNPLLLRDEIVLAARKNNPAKNDVIAFTHDNKIYIKRVIAAGGDQVDIRGDGKVSVNGSELSEPYVAQASLGNCDISFPFQVPSGMVFVLGDNRPTALDSRNSRFGTVSREQIIGKVFFRAWPLRRAGSIS